MPNRLAHRTGVASLLLLAFAGRVAAQDQTFGKDIPLTFAARQIVPSGYKVDIVPGVDADAKVTWPKSDNWRKSIQTAAASRGYVAKVDGQTVTISGPGAKVMKASTGPDVARVDGEPDSASPGPSGPDDDGGAVRRASRERKRQAMEGEFRHSRHRVRHEAMAEEGDGRRYRRHVRHERHERESEREAVAGPVVPDSGFVIMPEHVAERVSERGGPDRGGPSEPRGGSFVARQGSTLSGTLQEWAEREGWKVEWKGQFQYVLKGSARFEGDFVTATTELIRSMGEVRPQPTAEFFKGNKVVVVDNHGLDEAAQ